MKEKTELAQKKDTKEGDSSQGDFTMDKKITLMRRKASSVQVSFKHQSLFEGNSPLERKKNNSVKGIYAYCH